ncbi:non-homologous end joining protein Ku [Rhizorhapis sp. SPR117]|uniref:non-homologous end joining protein Ku n=1 Tax=Rhizorhapis sp. SPR117 TaxID=2912611 RepID=UPI001F0223B7|nr:Ku protein [Rhizorhapis sp. SPR117]
MAARPYWTGQIKLALVTIPVELYSATKGRATISFRQIHEPSGKPVKYEKIVPGIGPVDTDEIMKGYEYEKGSYVLLSPEEVDAVKLESKKVLELTQFVEATEIDPLYYEKPYYVVPTGELAEEAFIVLRNALRKSGKIGLGQLAMRGREYIVALRPCGRGLMLETLRYSDEVNRATSYFRDIGDEEPDADLLELAETLIERKSGSFDASAFHDRYVEALQRLVEKKRKAKGKRVIEEVEEESPRATGNVIDLMAALKKSVASEKKSASPRKSPAKKRA